MRDNAAARIPSALELESGFVIAAPAQELPAAKLIIGGDICPIARGAKLADPACAADIWAGISAPLASADLRIANLECPLSDKQNPLPKSGPVLSAKPDCAKGISAAGFDALTLANNHIMDHGGEGLADTLAACADAGIQTAGAGENLAAASAPLVVEAAGIRVAILAFAENEFSAAGRDRPGACPLDLPNNYLQIQSARQNAAFVLSVTMWDILTSTAFCPLYAWLSPRDCLKDSLYL